MTMKKVILGALLAITLAGCSSDDNNTLVNLADLRRPISVEVSENPIQNTGTEARDNTRVEATTTGSFDHFKMNYQAEVDGLIKYSVKKFNTDWLFTGAETASWPTTTNDPVTFYAFSYPGEETSNDVANPIYYFNSGNHYIHFTTDENASSMHDLLVAKETTSYNAHTPNGKVYLTFDHACAAVDFSFKKTAGVSGHSVILKKVVLKNMYKTGDYFFNDTPNWQNVSSTTDYTLYDGGQTLTTDSWTLPNNSFFIIPQTLTKIELTLMVDGELEANKKIGVINFTKTIESGNSYPIEIAVGTSLKTEEGNNIF